MMVPQSTFGGQTNAARMDPYAELATRLVDLKGIARPPEFDGAQEHWHDFRFKMESVALAVACHRRTLRAGCRDTNQRIDSALIDWMSIEDNKA